AGAAFPFPREEGEGVSAAAVEVWRGGLIESRHRVSVAVVDAHGRMRAQCGDPDLVVYARSAVKPFQAMPLVTDGAADQFGLTPPELALCCASHGGEPRHVDLARALLRKIGIDEEALACGPHPPMHEGSARALRESGRQPTRVHNNCSGKHAGMLALARTQGWPTAGYQRADHPLQQRMLREIAEWMRVPAEDIPTAIDGCGVLTFALPLARLAGGFARLATAARKGEEAPARIVAAMVGWPEHVAGSDRLCTELMRATDGRIFVKVGAEGVYCAGIPGAELGAALKVEDGATRASGPALLSVLRNLGLLSDEDMAALARWAEPDITNTRGERVGAIRANVRLEPCGG
ncbi:MAG: asparaginase, partial [Longimicrobiales bacterium]